MKILFCSSVFWPAIGGIETISSTLAEQFAKEGHDVIVVTQTPGPIPQNIGYGLVRCPGMLELVRLHRWCDLCFHNMLSLRLAGALLAVRRPWVVGVQTWITKETIIGRLKHILLKRIRTISCSTAIGQHLEGTTTRVSGPYDDDVFFERGDIPRTGGIVFVGRLDKSKGIDTLLDAVAVLVSRGVDVRVLIVGDGPYRTAIEGRISRENLQEIVRIHGRASGPEIASILNSYRILVVPSHWNEPFGIVALEGLACGCLVIGSAGGGLPEAIGPGGLTFPNGDSVVLAQKLEEVLQKKTVGSVLTDEMREHLRLHSKRNVARRYLSVFESVVKQNSK